MTDSHTLPGGDAELISARSAADFSVDEAKNWVRPRVSERRFKHIEGVARTARDLALFAGCDSHRAELAGWLHDAAKEIKDKTLVEEARRFGLTLHPVEEISGHLLHGPVAAEIVRQELGLKDFDLLNAIREHTLGAVGMSVLSMVVFLADAIEPGRSEDDRKPIWHILDRARGKEPDDVLAALDEAVQLCCDMGLSALISGNRVIHPRTVEVRNYYLEINTLRRQSRT